MARIFDTDALAGITRYWHVKDNGEFVIETVQQADAINTAT